ncbi:MAG: TonB-dependent receptor plug domain-containing protein [Massilia sp.]
MKRPLATALPLFALFSTTLHAQTAPPVVQQVQVTGSVETDARRNDVAGRMTVSREELLRYGDTNLSAVLQRQPGIAVTNGEVKMRGLGSGYTQILVNGQPVAQGFSIDSIAPSLIDRIEILRSGSAEYGTQAIAGTINVILKKAGGAPRRDLTLSAASRPGYASPTASLRVADQHGQLAWAMGADLSRIKSDYVSTIHETRNEADGSLSDERLIREFNDATTSRLGLTPRLNWTMDNGDSLQWQAVLDRTRQSTHGRMDETVQLGEGTDYPDNHARFNATTHAERSDLTWNHTVGADGKLEIKAGVNRNTRNGDYLFLGAGADATLARSVLSNVIDNTVSLNGKYHAPLGQAHSLGLGWEAGRTSRSEFRLQTDTSFTGAALGVLDEDYQAAITRLAVFAQDEWQLTPRLQVYLGLRWEGLDTSTVGRLLDEVRSQASVMSPIANLLWKLPDSDKDQLRLALSRSYKAPTSRQLVPRRYTTNNDNGPANPDVRGNPALRPELAWGLDAGYERYMGKSDVVSLSAYVRKIDQVTVQRLYQEGEDWMQSPTNMGSARAWGIEFDTKLALAHAMSLHANAARNWSRIAAIPGPYNRLDQQVPATVNLGLDYRHSAALTLGTNLNVQFGGTTRLSEARSAWSGPNPTLDVYALWKMNPGTQLRLTGTDLLARDGRSTLAYRDADFSTARETTVRSRSLVKLVLEKKL